MVTNLIVTVIMCAGLVLSVLSAMRWKAAERMVALAVLVLIGVAVRWLPDVIPEWHRRESEGLRELLQPVIDQMTPSTTTIPK